jgi:hypothetical protein
VVTLPAKPGTKEIVGKWLELSDDQLAIDAFKILNIEFCQLHVVAEDEENRAKSRKTGFIINRGNNQYNFSVENDQDLKEWVRALNQVTIRDAHALKYIRKGLLGEGS